MANLVNRLEGLIPSASELRDGTTWPDWLIEDYLALLRNILEISETVDNNERAVVDESTTQLNSLIADLRAKVGTGDKLTSDETGFTVDSTKLTVDMAEA